MSRIVVDADALIKLGKAGVLATLAEDHEVLIPGAVYEEAVVKGKMELYEDAFTLETVLREEGARILATNVERAGETESFLGPGERDALRVYREIGADAILSDDRVFLRFLGESSVPYATPAGMILGFVESGRLSPDAGLAALEKLRKHVRESVYRWAKEEIERRKGDDEG